MGESAGRLCEATKADGEPCRAYAIEGSRFCVFHDPAHAEELDAGRRAGGHARHGRSLERLFEAQDVELQTVADILDVLELAVRSTVSLEKSISRNRAIGYLCRQALDALERAGLEARLDALEARLRDLEDGDRGLHYDQQTDVRETARAA